MKLMAAFAVAIPLLLAESGQSAAHRVTGIREWSFADTTRVVVEVSGEFEIRTDRLHNPERVYFDILNSRPTLAARRGVPRDTGDRLVKRIRLAETVPGVSRVVLDLADGVEVTTSQLTNPNRLIIELRMGAAPAIPAVPAIPAPVPAAPPFVLPTSVGPAPAPAAAVKIAALPAEAPPVLASPGPIAAPAVVEDAVKIQPVKAAAPALAAKAAAAPAAAPPPDLAEVAKSARRTSTGENSLIRTLGLKINRVVIDPGHGGHDQGTSGPKGLLEKDVVLDVAQRLGKLIQERMNAEVIYTRTDDTFVPLEGRTALANDKKADLFLSIHANSSPAPRVAGIETYYLNFADSRSAMDVAARENASSQKSVFELRDLIQKITLHDKAEESREFASKVQTSLFAFESRNFPGEKNRGVRKAPFVVLIGANMPSILAEIGFLSNPKEEALLKRPEYRQKLAEALYRGVSRYAQGLSHFQMAQN